MTTVSSLATALAAFDGAELFSAPEALLKGVLEAEVELEVVAGPSVEPFHGIFALQQDEGPGYLLRRHGVRLVPTVDAARGIAEITRRVRQGRAGLALVANRQLAMATPSLVRLGQAAQRAPAAVLLEDHPASYPVTSPRQVARRLGWPVVEPSGLEQVRDAIEWATRLSATAGVPGAIVVHESILRSSMTLPVNPNRIADSVDEMLARRKRPRSPRTVGMADLLRVARRLEINSARGLPSPGEIEPIGLITVGPAHEAAMHLAYVLKMLGRLPVLQLGLTHPIDDSAVQRVLLRCRRVVVLESRPGEVETLVVDAAETLRRKGDTPATVWGRILPDRPDGTSVRITSDRDLHPSRLVRRMLHVLQEVRPTADLASFLADPPPPVAIEPPERGIRLGGTAAIQLIWSVLDDVQTWIDDQQETEDESIVPATTLAIDGVPPAGAEARVMPVWIWNHSRFESEGVSAIRQTAWSDEPAIVVVIESGAGDAGDLERLVRGAVPGRRADRVSIVVGNLADPAALREQLQEAAAHDRVTVLIAADGPPARFNVGAIEQSLAEIDRLGFQPRQWALGPAEDACAIRPRAEAATASPDTRIPDTEVTYDRLGRLNRRYAHLRARPILQQVLVERTRAPVWIDRLGPGPRPTPPTPIHAGEPAWRMHVAGYRGRGPGVAARAVCLAGRSMGYAVYAHHLPVVIGAGRRAWAQVLFTRPTRSGTRPSLATAIPYGEAQLLLGLDPNETLRALGPDPRLRIADARRTGAVVNIGPLDEAAVSPDREEVERTLQRAVRPDRLLVSDLAEASRAWFHTDRVTDLVALGAAFQRGLVPVTLDAMHQAMQQLENDGLGRSREAFEFGRRLSIDDDRSARPRRREEGVSRLARRIVRTERLSGCGAARRARRLDELVERGLDGMPGLTETDAGRHARRDYVVGLHHCMVCAGPRLAERYSELIAHLYVADRGDTGRDLTRCAVLPLAQAMIPIDSIQISRMVMCPLERQRQRRQLSVRRARGDRIESRYLMRFELIAFRRRLRIESRTSDWPVQLVAACRNVVPYAWRGTRADRRLRRLVVSSVERAASEASEQYELWQTRLRRLHDAAETGQLARFSDADLDPPDGSDESAVDVDQPARS